MKDYVTVLNVNEKQIELNHFTSQFLAHIVIGAASSLKGVDNIRGLILCHNQKDISLSVNEEDIPLSGFPRKIISSTMKGLIRSLNGVDSTDNYNVTVHL